MDTNYELREVNLFDDGLLYVINREVFHPEGMALAHSNGRFYILGDGVEPWSFDPDLATEKEAAWEAFTERLQSVVAAEESGNAGSF